jgi:hypothetical protein
MAGKAPDIKGLRVFPPPPKGFDPLAASKTDLARHGLPPRPDPRTQSGPAALWEMVARRYKDFDYLQPELLAPDKPRESLTPGFLDGIVSCGFELNFPLQSPSRQERGQSRTSTTSRRRRGFRTTSISSSALVCLTSTWK